MSHITVVNKAGKEIVIPTSHKDNFVGQGWEIVKKKKEVKDGK